MYEAYEWLIGDWTDIAIGIKMFILFGIWEAILTPIYNRYISWQFMKPKRQHDAELARLQAYMHRREHS